MKNQPRAAGSAGGSRRAAGSGEGAGDETKRQLALLEACFNTLAEGIVISDLQGHAISWNRAALEMHGYTGIEQCRRSLPEFQDTFEVLSAEGAIVPCEEWPMARILRGETVRDWEAMVHHKRAGWQRWFSYSGGLAKDAAGNPIIGVLSVADITERRRAEASLRLFRAQIEQANEAIELFDPSTGRFLDVNEKGCLDLGYTREEVLSLTVLDIDPTMDRPGFVKLMTELSQTRTAAVETIHRRKDGTSFPVEVSWKKIRLDRDYVVAVARDITERRRGERELDRERALLRTVIDLVPDHIYVKDVRCRFLLANRSVAGVMGAPSPESLIGKSDEEFYPRKASSEFRNDEEEVLNGAPIYNKEEPVTHPDGSQRFILTTKVPLKDSAGKIIGLVGIGRDFTDRKRIEEALRASEERLNFALETSRTGAWELDLVDHTAHRTLLHDRVFGYPALLPRWTYEMFLEHVLPEDRDAVDQKFRAATAAETDWTIECRIRRADGEVRWIWAAGINLRNSEGQPVRMSGILRDVTEHKQAEEKARRSEEQLHQVQKMESVGQLAAGIAHDFNNLLTVIAGYCELLRMELTGPPESAAALEEIAAAARRASNLTRQLLLFSRKQMAQRRLVNLNELTGNLTKMLGRILGEDIALQLDCQSGLPLVAADPGMMEQVITNLSVNARDAMPAGGRLEIATSVENLDAQQVSQNPDAQAGQFVCLTVKDSGSGIPPENLTRIFEPFFTTKEVGKGTGLGLATVYGIVMQHQGVIEVANQPDGGACFGIFLPVARKSEEASQGALPADGHGGVETILLVEDESVVLALVEKLLVRAGYKVKTANSGTSALRIWQEHGKVIDLLLTDMVMPEGLSGKQLAEQLRMQRPELPVIFMSGYSPDVRSHELGIEEGLNFLQKPFSQPALLRAVRRQLDARVSMGLREISAGSEGLGDWEGRKDVRD